jgi:hypothetical protein
LHAIYKINILCDSGCQGIEKIHANSKTPQKKSKKNPLTDKQKQQNRELSRERVTNENVIGSIKRFRIVVEKYRNRRKCFCLRFNLISAIHNLNLHL